MKPANPERLDLLRPGITAVIEELDFGQDDRVRLMQLGFIPGSSVSCQRVVPLGDLSIYQVEGGQIALRRDTAAKITLQTNHAGRSPSANGR